MVVAKRLKPVGATSKQCKLSLVLPRFREDYRTIDETLVRLTELQEVCDLQIIIVNDGGPGEPIDLLEKECRPGVMFVHNERNRGKGYSVARGVFLATGDYVCYSDIDLPVSITTITRAVGLLNSSSINYIIGNRFSASSTTVGASNKYRRFTSRWFLRIYNLLLEPKVLDTQCPFKIFPVGLAKRLFAAVTVRGYAFDAEVIHIAWLLGNAPSQIEVEWSDTRAPWSARRTVLVFVLMVKDLLLIKVIWLFGRYRLRSPVLWHRETPEASEARPVSQVEKAGQADNCVGEYGEIDIRVFLFYRCVVVDILTSAQKCDEGISYKESGLLIRRFVVRGRPTTLREIRSRYESWLASATMSN